MQPKFTPTSAPQVKKKQKYPTSPKAEVLNHLQHKMFSGIASVLTVGAALFTFINAASAVECPVDALKGFNLVATPCADPCCSFVVYIESGKVRAFFRFFHGSPQSILTALP